MVKVIASSLRKGAVVEHTDGKLYVILTTQNIHPGKGTPVTQVEMRRIVDGIKVTERFKTTDSVERAFVDERAYPYLYDDGSNFVFQNPDNMEVYLTLHNDVPLSAVLPTRVTLEITDTEPTVKGQTASSSYKPAMLSNGVRTMVPPYITAGTRIIVLTEDGSYVERAKD
jgi:elongation factor P